jgi:hypothetical protein
LQELADALFVVNDEYFGGHSISPMSKNGRWDVGLSSDPHRLLI